MIVREERRAVLIRRVMLKNYRSIAACDLELGPLVFLVGPNGSGKSNFLDALRLTTDALRTSLEHALRDRGGVKQVLRRSSGHPTHFGIRLDVRLPSGVLGAYAFEVSAQKGGTFIVKREHCRVGADFYDVHQGKLTRKSVEVIPQVASDRLYLVAASGLPQFQPLYEALSRMGFYNIQPERIREHQPPDQGDILSRDGKNLASVVQIMRSRHPEAMRRVEELLSQIVPGVEGVESKPVGHMITLEFRQHVENAKAPWRFPAINMSDGTLRALSILVALFQPGVRTDVPLVGIEEPEIALHPAAAGVLLDALRLASRHTQVLITSHSPDLLEDSELQAKEILAVESTDGTTQIAAVDEASRTAMRDRLYSAGELLRANQLQPDPSALFEPNQLDLFQTSAHE